MKSLELRGVRSVSRRDLAQGLAMAPTPWWKLRTRRIYDELLLDADRERILRYYEAHGYFHAAVTSAEARARKDRRSLDVIVAIEEGSPTLIDELKVHGLTGLSPELIHRLQEEQFSLRRGQRFVHERYLQFKDRMRALLKDNGYAWARVDGDVVVDKARHTALIDITLLPGPAVRVGSVAVEPAEPAVAPDAELTTLRLRRRDEIPIDQHVLLRSFGVKEGSWFNLAALEEGKARLLQLHVFSSVGMYYVSDPEDPGVVHVKLRLGGASLHELRIGVGVGIEALRNEVRAQLLYTKRSFLGGLRTVELRLRPAYVVVPAVWDTIVRHGPALTTDATFTQPNLGPFSKLSFILGYDVGIDYGYQYHGPRAQLGVARLLWRDRISLAVSYDFQFLDFFSTSPEILAAGDQAGILYGYHELYRLGWFQEEARLDWRDSRTAPRKGFLVEIIAEQGSTYTGGAFTYEKLKGGVRGYAPLGRRVVLAARVEMAQAWSQGDNGTPTTRRLALGGPTTHRGFAEGRLSPQIPTADGLPLPIGGDQSFLVSGEVRVDVVRLAGNMLSAGSFVDAGDVGAARGDTVSGWQRGVDWGRLHAAVGAGLRYRTPIGSLRADVGVRVNRVSPTEADGTPNPDPGRRVAFHFSLAEAF